MPFDVSDSPAPSAVQLVQTVVAGTPITVNPQNAVITIVQVQTGGAVTMSATPIIAAGRDGQVIWLMNVDSNVLHTIVFTDLGTLPGSLLSLKAATVTLNSKASLGLVYNVAIGAWVQL